MDKITTALRTRYSLHLSQLAKPIAKELHASLDAQVVAELGEVARRELDLSEESWELSGRLRQWYRRAKTSAVALGVVGLASLGIFTANRDSQTRLIAAHVALTSGLLAGSQRRTQRETATIAGTLGRIEAAQAAMSLVRTVKPVKVIGDRDRFTRSHQPEVILPSSATESSPPTFDPQRILEEATGIGLLGNSGSAKTCIAKLLAGSVANSQILVLDPHDDPKQTLWEGLTVIRDYPLIVRQLELLLDLLEKRDRTQLVILCDEWPAVRAYCKQEGLKTADEFLLRYGSEARKFNKLPIFCSQSGNVAALGLEGMGDFLENFLLVRLGRVAIKHARNLPDQSVLAWCKSVGYPCLIGDEPHVHPTHGHHPQAYKGAAPKGLVPLQSLPLTIPLAA